MIEVEQAKREVRGGANPAEVAVINPLQYPAWDQLVAAHPDGAFFHGTAWARVLHETYGHQAAYFGSVQAGRLLGVLPTMEVDSLLTGRRGISLPFSDECNVLSSETVSAGQLFETCLAHGRKRGWRSFESRGMAEGMGRATPSLKFYSHRIELGRGADALWAGFKSRVRTPVRRAQEAGVKITFETGPEAIQDYYLLHGRTRRKHGLPPQPFSFFRNIQQHVLARGLGWIAVARWEGKVVAAGVFVHLGKRALHKFGASEPALQHLCANHLLMWETIQRCCGLGFDSLDLGRTSIGNEGLRQFKLGFGTRESEIRYCRYDYRADSFVVDRDQVEGWFNHVFRRLPMPLLRLAGRMLYPHVA